MRLPPTASVHRRPSRCYKYARRFFFGGRVESSSLRLLLLACRLRLRRQSTMRGLLSCAVAVAAAVQAADALCAGGYW